ncbi:glutamate-5-semialdehyde dehydrogenase [Candidatus Raskinella chloraquaticus]|uniref:Gamma-glutamyl phosphate reductase n=1 Tax=Candidatus Raskinella chloraquaticus TaxID=1951219 RepID=A0A1W9HUD4_9HYPH|nr:MAG: gamma-glutamyl-phosphate reductase [Proteobacteria bacterium SG_bin8]
MNIPLTPSNAATVEALLLTMGGQARAAQAVVRRLDSRTKKAGLAAMAQAIRAASDAILAANDHDLAAAAQKGLASSFVDRMRLDGAKVEAIAAGIETIAALADPVGKVLASWTQANGLVIERVARPIGVIGIIYESRPNVTADAGALCFAAGNAAILRSGSDSLASAQAIHGAMVSGLDKAGIDRHAIQLVGSADRAAVGAMLAGLDGAIDVIVPRGGRSLVERVMAEARVPVFAHLEGVCHIYVDHTADLAMAERIVLNAKMRRPEVCGAAETLLVEKAALASHLAPLVNALIAAGCEVRGDAATLALDPRVRSASDADWHAEYLAPIIAVRVVDDIDAAMAHIARYGSSHTEAIVTGDAIAAERFLNEVDSAIVLHNASTQFADGGEFGMGAEIGIATGRLHARGPVGVEQLTSFNYRLRGHGQIRA